MGFTLIYDHNIAGSASLAPLAQRPFLEGIVNCMIQPPINWENTCLFTCATPAFSYRGVKGNFRKSGYRPLS
jgi:hypothetical protein